MHRWDKHLGTELLGVGILAVRAILGTKFLNCHLTIVCRSWSVTECIMSAFSADIMCYIVKL